MWYGKRYEAKGAICWVSYRILLATRSCGLAAWFTDVEVWSRLGWLPFIVVDCLGELEYSRSHSQAEIFPILK